MSEEKTAEAQPRKGGALMTMIVGLASLAVGAGAGVVVVGPMFAGGGEAKEALGETDGGHGGGGGGHGGGGEESLWQIDNLVVNPKDTQGTRFLVVALAVRMSDGSTPQNMQGSDPEVRDAVLGLLSGLTVEQLSDPASRDSLKTSLKDAIESVIGKNRIASVLLPQFVLQ